MFFSNPGSMDGLVLICPKISRLILFTSPFLFFFFKYYPITSFFAGAEGGGWLCTGSWRISTGRECNKSDHLWYLQRLVSSLVCLEHSILLGEFFVKGIRGKVIEHYESQSKKCRFYCRQWRLLKVSEEANDISDLYNRKITVTPV